jgi:hypothetical protein
MTQRRTRKLKALKQDRPPFAPLLPEDVQLIANEGGFGSVEGSDLFDALEVLRVKYRACLRWREVTASDQQLRADIEVALKQIAGLKSFFVSGRIVMTCTALFHCNQQQLGAVPDPEHPARLIPLAQQRSALEYLEGWVRHLSDELERLAAIKPNWFLPPSAEKLGQNELVIGLADLWCEWSGEVEASIARRSRWIQFLRQGLKTIAHLDIGADAACKLSHRALEYSTSAEYKLSQQEEW